MIAVPTGAAQAHTDAAPAVASASVSPAAAADVAPAAAPVKPMANLANFNPGNIINNAVFFNKSTMTESQIQAFLQAKVPRCEPGYTCLKDWYDTSRTTAADAMCGAYSGGVRERASRIIYKVAQACGINPQVLLTTLQKEQGLVTHVWPSEWRYTIAMGQGCPDTAACDTRYYGFFNQVYGAAWQMKRYANPPGTSQYFTWYAPGKTWNILYHPNRACGSSPVYVQNQATANLYYYTPYQPNGPALAAGYGTGDGCSSYGNRNFYNYFTDWFGSTQAVGQVLVKSGSDIWLITENRRYHVTSDAYPEYKSVLGAPAVVDAAYVGLFEASGFADVFVRNTSTGVVAMIQGGKTHRFATCALVAAWGGACGSALVQLANREFTRFGVGPEMSTFAYPADGTRIHRMSGTQLDPVFDAATAVRMNGGTVPYVGIMRASVAASYTKSTRVQFATGDFVMEQGRPEVYLATPDGKLVHLRSWPQASELGLSATVAARAPAADLTGYTRTGQISTFVSCGGVSYFAASGVLSRLSAGAPAGFPVTALDSATCAKLRLSGPTIPGKVFVKVPGESHVYDLAGGYARHVANEAQLIALNGGTWPTVLTISKAALALYPSGGTYPTDGTLIRAEGSGDIFFFDSGRLLHLPSWGLARAYGLSSAVNVIPPADFATYPQAGALTHFVSCGGTLYAAGGDMLSKVASGDAAGNPVVEISASTCKTLKLTGATIPGQVFVTDGTNTAVAVGGGFLRLPDRDSILRANGGTMPAAKWVTVAYFGSLPQPAQLPKAGDLVRASDSTMVTFVDASRRLPVSNWGIPEDLGVRARYTLVSPAAVATAPVSATAASVFVRCGSVDYVAAQGILSAITPTGLGGIVPVPLDAATCATLNLTGAPIAGRVFVQAAGAAQVYVTESGGLRPLRGDESATTLNGGTPPRILVMDSRTVGGTPKR